MATATKLETTRQLKKSVKRNETGIDDTGVINFFINSFRRRGTALPPTLPDTSPFAFYRERDIVLLSTPKYDSQWANAIAIGTAKMAAMGWDIESKFKNRRDDLQSMLLEAGAGMGLFGWVPFLSMHLRSYLTTGIAFVEIERESNSRMSKVINIHHLNPLRCRLTGNPKFPANYMTKNSEIKELAWYQVMIISDMPDPTEGEDGVIQSAASRAYQQIIKLSAIETYIYEKVTGRRPLAINFVGGLTRRALDDIMQTTANESDRRGLTSYGGISVVPIPGDTPVSIVTVPISELPDITDVERERNRSDLIYANAIGLDPQDLNPAILGRQGLGSTGNQSIVLRNKEKGRQLAKWRQEFAHQFNTLVADSSSTFAFSERDLGDDEQEATNKKLRNEDRKIMIETGMITPDQARNLAVDADDLPQEFIDHDETGGDSLRDDQKPKDEKEPSKSDENNEVPPPEPEGTEKAYPDPDLEGVDLVKVLRPLTADEWKEAEFQRDRDSTLAELLDEGVFEGREKELLSLINSDDEWREAYH